MVPTPLATPVSRELARILAAEGNALDHDPALIAIPEPVVKRALSDFGVMVPRGAVVTDPSGLPAAVDGLRPPFALKAFGAGVVHKRDVGAVRLGLGVDDLPAAVDAMTSALAARSLVPAGFLVEEQHPGGLELVIGVVRRPPFGAVAVLGIGGTFVEDYDVGVSRLCPLRPADAREMLDAWPGASVFRDGGPRAVDAEAVLGVLLALAGEGGFAEALGPALSELECNPVVATVDGALALDARLVLDPDPVPVASPPAPTDFGRLFEPRAIAVAGASTSKVTFGNRFLAAYRDAGWTDGLHAVHPSAAEIDGVPAVSSVADIPGGVDYLLVALPAAQCAGVVADATGAVTFAHVVAGGFGETGPDGTQLEAELLDAARQAQVRVLGPNCLGVFSPRGRQTFQLGAPRVAGPVGVISQSGGLAGDIVMAGDRRGIRFSKLVTVGNAIDVGTGELLEYLVHDPETEVIGLYLEGARDGERLVGALRAARGRTPIVALVAGVSAQGAQAATSHTGAMTGDRRVWSAVSASTGLTIVDTLDDLLAVLSFLQHNARSEAGGDASVLVVGPGGGASVLATDACDRRGLAVTPVATEARDELRALGYGAGTSVANPIEIPLGPATSADAFVRVLDVVLAVQEYPDVLLHVNVQSYYGYGTGGVAPLLEVLAHLRALERPDTRVALVLRNLDCAPPADAAVLLDAVTAGTFPVLRSFDEAALAIAAAQRFARDRTTTP